MNYKRNSNIVYSCKYHIIWCSKYRRKVLVGAIEQRLKQLIYEVATLAVEVIEVETDKDHIHLLAEVNPQYGRIVILWPLLVVHLWLL